MTIETNDQCKRVVLVSYACSPYRGSEPGDGWYRAVETAKYFNTWVICGRREFKEEIKRYFAENGGISGLRFCFLPRTQFEKRLWKMPGLYYLGYNFWQRRAYRIALKLHEEFNFEIVHQVNWCGFREPGYLWKLGVPFIWGPVGGTQNYPWRFLRQAGIIGALKEATRGVLNVLQLRFSSRVRKAAKKVSVLLTANSTGQRDFRRVHKVNPILLLETGITTLKKKSSTRNDLCGPLKILWSGQFKHNKALQLLLFALVKIPRGFEYELRILGQGPLEKRWHRLSRRLGVEPFTNWMGWLPLDEAMRQYEWADILVFTSLRDTSGGVVLEALSHGVPVICLDHQGVGDIITDSCGIKIPVTTPGKVIQDLREAIVLIAQDKRRLKVLSQGAIERARDYLWSRNGEQMAELYQKVLNLHSVQDHAPKDE